MFSLAGFDLSSSFLLLGSGFEGGIFFGCCFFGLVFVVWVLAIYQEKTKRK